jgi:pSer/pThr/pTyr-binding forkhead associated (FHA) protein
MYCQECGKEAQPGEVICSSCGGALTDAELDLPEVAAYPVSPPAEAGEEPLAGETETPTAPRMPLAPPMPESLSAGQPQGPHLEVTVGSLSGSYELNPSITTVGRADPTVGYRPDVDLSMDQAVSRRHAEIRRGSAGYVIFDLGSTNGTIVNGRQIPRQQEVPLADGDEIRVGESCKLIVRL